MTFADLFFVALGVFVLFNIVMGAVLVIIYVERKVLGRLQQRMGPMRTGPHGIFQTLADAVKLLLKEDLKPADVNMLIFYLSPLLVFAPIFMLWVALPFSSTLVLSDLNLGIFYVVAVLGLSVVGMVLAGWSSNNKYSLLGGARSAAQLISYELPLVLSVLGVALWAQSLNLTEVVEAQGRVPYLFLMPLGFFLFLVAAFAETGRIPFDIPHAEEEIVGGPMVEYSGIRWAVFFLAEYAGMLTMALIGTVLFLGGWHGPFSESVPLLQTFWLLVKVAAVIFVIIWVRAPLPRLRIDQLMAFAWKFTIPLSFGNLILIAAALFYGWPGWLLGVLSGLMLLAALYGMAWRRERRLAQLRRRWAQ